MLEGDEAAAFERQLETDGELRELVDELDAAAAALAHGAAPRTLPPELRERILSEVTRSKVTAFPRRVGWLPWAVAAGFALATAYLIAERTTLKNRVTQLEERDNLARIQIASLSSKLENAPNANAVVVWDESKQRGILQVTALPRNAKDRDYQLWMVTPDRKNPVGAGTFHVSNDGTLSVPFQPDVVGERR